MTTTSQVEWDLQTQLELARQVQLSLLPERRCCLSGWDVAFSYESAGYVSGDYVDLIPAGADAFYFALGDVSGKGVAASMLMSHLHATLRALLLSRGSIEEIVTIASQTFCQSALPAQFATLVLGKSERDGGLELVNAGHNQVLLLDGTEVEVIAAASLPLGMFCSTEFTTQKRRIKPGSTLFLYSDGITESTNEAGIEFDMNRLVEKLRESEGLPPSAIVHTIQGALARYTKGEPLNDDRTMLALRWAGTGI